MKVVFLVGYEKINERLYNSGVTLQRHGCTITTLLWRRGMIKEVQRTPEEDEAMGAMYIGPGSSGGGLALLGSFVAFHRAAYRALVDERPDVLHVAHLILLPLAIRLKGRLKCRVIYDAYEFHAFSIAERLSRFMPFALAKRIMYAAEGALIRRCDGVVTIDSNSGVLKRRYLQNTRNVEVLFNVPPAELEIDSGVRASVGMRYDGIPLILYVGGVTREKGGLRMVAALSEVRRRVPNARLLIVGRFRAGGEREFWALAERVGVEDAIDMVDWQPFGVMCAYMATASVGLALYNDSPRFRLLGGGNGRKLFMYMYFGVPIVMTEMGAVGRIVAEEGCGLLVPTDKRERMADAIVRLLEDKGLNARMGRAGRAAIRRQYNWGAEKGKLLEVYRSAGAKLPNLQERDRGGDGHGRACPESWACHPDR